MYQTTHACHHQPHAHMCSCKHLQTQPHLHTYFAVILAIISYFLFLKPEGRYGPHEVWAHMGWVGHPAH